MKLFSLGDTEIKCSPLLLVLLPAAAVLGSVRLLIIAFLSLCMHEAAHAMAARRLGYSVTGVEIMPFGFIARLDVSEAPPGDAAAVFAAGPVASLSMAAISALLEGIVPGCGIAELGLTEYNLLLAAVNLLPALPLDGGRLLSAAFSAGGRRKANRLLRSIGVLTGAVFIAIFLLLIANGAVNPTFFLMGVFLVISAVREHERPGIRPVRIRREAAVSVRSVAVAADTGLVRAVGLLPPRGYAVVSVVGENGRRIAELDGNSLIEAAGILGSGARVKDAVALYGKKMV